MPSDAERETLLVGVVQVQLLRERLIGCTRSAVGGTCRATRGEGTEAAEAAAVEAARAAILRETLRETRGSSVAAGLLLLGQLLVGARSRC